jgi:hypothetical protein
VEVVASLVSGVSLPSPQAHSDRQNASAKSRKIAFFICVPSFYKTKKYVAEAGCQKTHIII